MDLECCHKQMMRPAPQEYTYNLRHAIVALYSCILIPAFISISIYWMYIYLEANSPWITNLPVEWLVCRLIFSGFWVTFMLVSMTCPAIFSEGSACVRCSPILIVGAAELVASLVLPKHCAIALYAAIFNFVIYLHHVSTDWWKAYTRKPVALLSAKSASVGSFVVEMAPPQAQVFVSVPSQPETSIYPTIPTTQ